MLLILKRTPDKGYILEITYSDRVIDLLTYPHSSLIKIPLT